jgi:hypothetical protein
MDNMILAHDSELSERPEREFMEWTQKGGTRMRSSFGGSMRREVCRERLVYLDLVRTFPDTSVPDCIHANTWLNSHIE